MKLSSNLVPPCNKEEEQKYGKTLMRIMEWILSLICHVVLIKHFPAISQWERKALAVHISRVSVPQPSEQSERTAKFTTSLYSHCFARDFFDLNKLDNYWINKFLSLACALALKVSLTSKASRCKLLNSALKEFQDFKTLAMRKFLKKFLN